MEFDIVSLSLLTASALRLAVPLVLAAIAGLYAEKSGAIDIGLEGKMLAGAFMGGACASYWSDPWVGLVGAMVGALAMAMAQAFSVVHLRGNQLVIGLAINIIASGLTAFLGISWYKRGGQTPQLDTVERFQPITLPGADLIANVPVLGPIYANVLSGHTILGYLALLVVLVTVVVLYRTRFGLRLAACGDKPEALDTAGVSVYGMRYKAFAINGLLCGVAGAYLAIVQGGAFYKDMTAGQGYIALTALIFGNWKPVRVFFACLLFAFADAVQGRLQGTEFAGFEIPTQLIQALPYILTLLLLAGVMGKPEGPATAGKPYIKGER